MYSEDLHLEMTTSVFFVCCFFAATYSVRYDHVWNEFFSVGGRHIEEHCFAWVQADHCGGEAQCVPAAALTYFTTLEFVIWHVRLLYDPVFVSLMTFWTQLLMVVSIVLERNPELEFQEAVDLDRLVNDAFADFQKDRSRLDGSEKQVRAD